MAVVIEVSFDDVSPRESFEELRKFGEDQSGLMGNIADAMRTQTMERIGKTKTDPDGRKWTANKAGTPTLVATTSLLTTIGARSGPDYAQVGSAMPYAAIHQTGGEITRTYRRGLAFTSAGTFSTQWTIKIPARPYLGIGADDREDIENLVGVALVAALKPKGGAGDA